MASQVYDYTFIPSHQDYLPETHGNPPRNDGTNDRIYVWSRRSHNSALPISLLPPELLLQILTCALPTPLTPSSLLRFGAVCHTWRAIVFSSTSLWCYLPLHFQYSEYAAPSPPIPTQMIQEWIDRAGPTRPLTLSMKCTVFTLLSRFPWCPFVEPSKLLLFLGGYAHRWGRLDLSIPISWFSSFFHHLYFPRLTSITLRPFDVDPRVVKPGLCLGQCLTGWTAPALQRVELHGVELSGPMSRGVLPWAQLRYIALYDTRAEGFLEVLPHCTSAVEIKVTILWGTYQPLGSSLPSSVLTLTPVQADLPHLSHLLLFAEDPGFAVQTLSGLFAPSLQRLTTNLFHDRLGALPAALRSFIVRCRLRRMVLGVNMAESKVTEAGCRELSMGLTAQTGARVVYEDSVLR